MSHYLIAPESLEFARLWLEQTANGGPVEYKNGGICFNLSEALKAHKLPAHGYSICQLVFEMMGFGYENGPYPLGGLEAYDREWRAGTLWKGDKRRKFCAEMVPHVQRLINRGVW